MLNKKIYFFSYALLSVIIVGHVLNIPALILIATIGISLGILIPDIYVSSSVLFFFFPFSCILAFNQYNLCIFLAVSYIVKSALKGKLHRYYFYTLLLMLYCFIFADSSVGIKLGTLISPILLALVIFVCQETRKEDYQAYIKFFTNSFICSAIVGFFKEEIPSISRLFGENALYIEGVEESMDIERFGGLCYDPNFYTVIACILISIILFNSTKITTTNIIQLVFLVITGFLTFSKSFFLIIIFIGAVYFIRNSKHIVRNTALFFVLVVITVIVEKVLEMEIVSLLISRFTVAESADDLTTGRADLWYEYIIYIIRNASVLFFGEGFNSLGLRKAVHNTFLEFIFNFGLIGTLLWIVYFVMCYSVMKKNNGIKFKLSNSMPIWACICCLFFLSAFHFQQLWCCVALALFALYKPSDEVEGRRIIKQ